MLEPVSYSVAPVDPSGHLFRVNLQVPNPDPAGQVLRLPAWIPGSYMVREFARHIVRIEAWDLRGPLPLRQLDKDTWQAEAAEGPLSVTIDVYAWDLSVRTAHLDTTHGFFNGTSLFLCAVGHEHRPHRVEIVPPDHPACADWKLATTLPRLSGQPWAFGTFEAADYDALIDHPVEMGTFVHARFEACGVPHDVVITGRARCDLRRLCHDLQPICEAQIRLFGEPAPFDRYLFLVMAVGDGYGGLEHRSSTALICKRTDLPQPGVEELSDDYRGFLGLCSHEYFHSWNVKRIKPRLFVPYDLRREAHTTLLWAFEGITSYYDDLMLLRAGRIDLSSYLELLGRTATQVERMPGRQVETLATASFDAWTKYYRQDENFPNAHVSYYTKGALTALALDLTLRERTHDRVSLDDLMRALWARYGDGSGVPEDGVEALASELAGVDLRPFFDLAIRSTEPLPLPALLASVGLRWQTRAAQSEKDPGGKAARPDGVEQPGDLGLKTGPGGKIVHVYTGGPAHQGGVSAGDVLVALDGLKVDDTNLLKRVRALPAGSPVRLHTFRRDELMEFDLVLAPPPESTVYVEVDAGAEEAAVMRRERWARGG